MSGAGDLPQHDTVRDVRGGRGVRYGGRTIGSPSRLSRHGRTDIHPAGGVLQCRNLYGRVYPYPEILPAVYRSARRQCRRTQRHHDGGRGSELPHLSLPLASGVQIRFVRRLDRLSRTGICLRRYADVRCDSRPAAYGKYDCREHHLLCLSARQAVSPALQDAAIRRRRADRHRLRQLYRHQRRRYAVVLPAGFDYRADAAPTLRTLGGSRRPYDERSRALLRRRYLHLELPRRHDDRRSERRRLGREHHGVVLHLRRPLYRARTSDLQVHS